MHSYNFFHSCRVFAALPSLQFHINLGQRIVLGLFLLIDRYLPPPHDPYSNKACAK